MLEGDQRALVKTNGYLVQNMLELELKQGMNPQNDKQKESKIEEMNKQLEEKLLILIRETNQKLEDKDKKLKDALQMIENLKKYSFQKSDQKDAQLEMQIKIRDKMRN